MLQISEISFYFQNRQNFLQKIGDIPILICFGCQIVEIWQRKNTNYNMCSMAHATLMEDENYFNVGLF